MKTKSTLLLALALGLASLSTASAGLITDPLSVQAPISDQGLATDPLGQGGPLSGPKPVNVSAAAQFLASIISDGQPVRLSDLMLNPEFFAAAHAAGPEADALRGQIDWLMLSGLILGLDGDDGLDDLTGDAGDDLDGDDGLDDFRPMPLNFSWGTTNYVRPDALNWSWGASNPAIILGGPGSDNIILGGPGGDTLAPFIPTTNNIILGGPGGDTLAPFIPTTSNIILGGPGGDTLAPFIPTTNNIILGGPGGDTLTNDFVFGTTSYLK